MFRNWSRKKHSSHNPAENRAELRGGWTLLEGGLKEMFGKVLAKNWMVGKYSCSKWFLFLWKQWNLTLSRKLYSRYIKKISLTHIKGDNKIRNEFVTYSKPKCDFTYFLPGNCCLNPLYSVTYAVLWLIFFMIYVVPLYWCHEKIDNFNYRVVPSTNSNWEASLLLHLNHHDISLCSWQKSGYWLLDSVSVTAWNVAWIISTW